MAATQDGLGRVAWKRGIEGHGTQEILRGNHREMDRHTANSGKKSTKTPNITCCLHDFEKPRLFFRMNTFTRSRLTKIKVIFIIDRAKCFHTFEVREEPHNLKLALCIVSGEVEYAYCGPSCTAGKSGSCNHILALMCPLVWLLYCLYEQRAKRGEDYVWSRSLGYPPWETVLLLFKYFLPVAAL